MLKRHLYFFSSNFILYYFFKLSVFFIKFDYFSKNVISFYNSYIASYILNSLVFKFFNYCGIFFFTKVLNFFFTKVFGFYIILNISGIGLMFESYFSFLYKFNFASSHNVYLYLPKEFILKFYNNDFIVFSINKQRVNNFVSNLLLINRFDVYTVKGLKLTNKLNFLKEGKKR